MAFVSSIITVAQQKQAILPSNFDLPEFAREFELAKFLTLVLSNLKNVNEWVDNTLLATGSEAMRSILNIHDYVNASAKYQHGLKSVTEQLGERFREIEQSQRCNLREAPNP